MPSLRLVAVLAAALPLVAAAFPWNDITRDPHWHRVLWTPFLSGYRVKDAILNILVTVPIGVTAGAIVRRRAWLTASAVAGAVSVFCEFAQVFAPDRFPSGTDVFCNVLGAGLGVLLLEFRWPEWSARRQQVASKNL